MEYMKDGWIPTCLVFGIILLVAVFSWSCRISDKLMMFYLEDKKPTFIKMINLDLSEKKTHESIEISGVSKAWYCSM